MIASLIFVFIVLFNLTFATYEDEKRVNSARDKVAKYCFLPPYPDHGRYTVSNYPFATPGDSYEYVKLDVTCDIGYQNGNATNSILCINGFWSEKMSSCVPESGFCRLKDELSVEYRCEWVLGSLKRSQECPYLVPSGTVVRPICRSPAYFSLRVLSEMHCKDGFWDYNPICKPACGLITQHLKLEGSSTNHVELSWHSVIYMKKKLESYDYRCSGSLITASKIISAAMCFYGMNGMLLPASEFVVAVNKIYEDYNDPRDINKQLSDVVDIKIPSNYRSVTTYLTNTIAIVVVEKSFIFHLSVRPVCLDLDNDLDRTELTKRNSGKVARWSNHDKSAQMSDVLNVDDLQCIKIEDCYDLLPTRFHTLLNTYKFCAINSNDTRRRTNRGTGQGIAFLESKTQRYYLLGVVFHLFHTRKYTDLYMFFSIVEHKDFIKQHL